MSFEDLAMDFFDQRADVTPIWEATRGISRQMAHLGAIARELRWITPGTIGGLAVWWLMHTSNRKSAHGDTKGSRTAKEEADKL